MKKAFLAFPEQSELLLSELQRRFGIKQKPAAVYGDLFYFEDLPETSAPDAPSPSQTIKPYWARTIMEEPFFLNLLLQYSEKRLFCSFKKMLCI